ncbi:uncharacterized protein LOC113561682 [Ooceraea biroi]|uniref:uncharacterized protein LOC113561682 n=1 Tax=Ooceraea biroi TaxID=2015173 RepID=UPI000F08F342|nr:uncharacterized protein LOC113561682 [Ooceraea biroi]
MITLSELCNNTKRNTNYERDVDNTEVENIKDDFLQYSKTLAIARQREENLNAFFETCSIHVPQVTDDQMHSIDTWEWPIIYDIVGSVVHSIKCTNMTVCDKCFTGVLWKGEGHHPYSFIVKMRSYEENSLLCVSDSCFKAILKTEITFRNLADTLIQLKDMNIVQFLTAEVQYVWEGANIPLCHNISTKILKRFIAMRLRIHGLNRRKQCAEMNIERSYNSKTIARFTTIY